MNLAKKGRGIQFDIDIHHVLIEVSPSTRKNIIKSEHESWIKPLMESDKMTKDTQSGRIRSLFLPAILMTWDTQLLQKYSISQETELGNISVQQSLLFHRTLWMVITTVGF